MTAPGRGRQTIDLACIEAPSKQGMLEAMGTLTKRSKDDRKDAEWKDKDAVQLKKFLIQHVGTDSRYLPAIRREMTHIKDMKSDVPDGITLSEGDSLTAQDCEEILKSGIVSFFMDEIVGSASTQVEILKEQGSWVEALDKEEKPTPGQGPEVYTYKGRYSGTEFSELIGDERETQNFTP